MKRTAMLGCVGAVGLCAIAGYAQGTDRAGAPGKEVRSIAITATDRVSSKADLATVHIGYTLYGPTHDAAYGTGSRTSQAITKALEGAGVPPDAIESQEQSLQATEGDVLKVFPAAVRSAHAFTVSQSWTVRVPAADGTQVLDLAVKAGANDSGAIDWSLRDVNAAQAAAAAKAIQRARTQAAAMANGLNVRLGTLLYASNEVNAAAAPNPMEQQLLRAPAKMTAGMPPPPPPPPMAINPQQIETAATVYAVFAIE